MNSFFLLPQNGNKMFVENNIILPIPKYVLHVFWVPNQSVLYPHNLYQAMPPYQIVKI